ncbi:MAG: hypothetical protein PUB35_00945, partial [Campylobacteraceae bacterium]|nr:hypothetical protein [Campylobacteraceae bacterium]
TTGTAKAKWSDITNVPLDGAGSDAVGTTATARLKAGKQNCIGVQLVEKAGNIPAHIVFTKESATAGTVCKQVQDSDPLKVYFESKANNAAGKMAIGSSTSVY